MLLTNVTFCSLFFSSQWETKQCTLVVTVSIRVDLSLEEFLKIYFFLELKFRHELQQELLYEDCLRKFQHAFICYYLASENIFKRFKLVWQLPQKRFVFHHVQSYARSSSILNTYKTHSGRYRVPKLRSLSIRNSLIIISGEIHY